MVFLGRREPGAKWTPKDRELARALAEHEASIHPGCGHPRDVATDAALINDWAVEVEFCFACEAIARKAKDVSARPDYLPGAVSYRARLVTDDDDEGVG